jgi:hypothetical protein
VLGALALDFCALTVLLRQPALGCGLVRLVVLTPELGAPFVGRRSALVRVLGAFVRRDAPVPRCGLTVIHRGHPVRPGGTTLVPVSTRFVPPSEVITDARS